VEKYYDPKTKKNQDLFETLNPVFAVSCKTPDIVIGDKGAEVNIIIEACNENEAIDKALLNQEFTEHIRMKDLKTKYLDVYKPSGFYVIGRVNYYGGDSKL
jgi:hypothetical protein